MRRILRLIAALLFTVGILAFIFGLVGLFGSGDNSMVAVSLGGLVAIVQGATLEVFTDIAADLRALREHMTA